jgi:2TM domain
MRGFLIHLTVFIVVIVGLAALNLIRNPVHPWFLWVLCAWGIALAVHDLVLLLKSRQKREIPRRPSSSDEAQSGV